MLMNRRKMLSFSLATVALTLTGCKSNTTTIKVYNYTHLNEDGSESDAGGALNIDASAKQDGRTYRFRKNKIKVRGSAQQKYVSRLNKGTVVNFTVNSLTIGGDAPAFDVDGLEVVVGTTNVFYVFADGAVRTKPEVN